MIGCKALTHRQKDIAWMSAPAYLPIKTFLFRRRLIPSAQCPRFQCGNEESVFHLLWGCSHAKKFWDLLRPFLKCIAGITMLSYEMLLYGFSLPTPALYTLTAWKLLNCGKETLWETRNGFLFHQKVWDPYACRNLCLSKLMTYVHVDKARLGEQRAHEIWQMAKWRDWIT